MTLRVEISNTYHDVFKNKILMWSQLRQYRVPSPSIICVTARLHYEKMWGRKTKLVERCLSIWVGRPDTERIILTDEKLWKRQTDRRSCLNIDELVFDSLHFLRVKEQEKHSLERLVKWPLRRPLQSEEWRSRLRWKVERCISQRKTGLTTCRAGAIQHVRNL